MSFMLGTENGKGYFQLLSQGGLLVLASLTGTPGLLAWFPGEPDNLEGGENCAMIYGYANPEKKPFWNDYHCSHSNSPYGLLFSICQRSF